MDYNEVEDILWFRGWCLHTNWFKRGSAEHKESLRAGIARLRQQRKG